MRIAAQETDLCHFDRGITSGAVVRVIHRSCRACPLPKQSATLLAGKGSRWSTGPHMLPGRAMNVWALRNPNGSFRGKFHRHDSYDCQGRRMYEETYADQDDYVLVDLRELSSRQGACQFECCFQGLADAAAVAGSYLGGTAAPSPPRWRTALCHRLAASPLDKRSCSGTCPPPRRRPARSSTDAVPIRQEVRSRATHP